MASVNGMGWTAVDGVGWMSMVGIFCGCRILIRLLAHPFVSFQIIPWEKFAFGRLRGIVIIFCQRSGLLFKLLDACQSVIIVIK